MKLAERIEVQNHSGIVFAKIGGNSSVVGAGGERSGVHALAIVCLVQRGVRERGTAATGVETQICVR